MHSNEEEAAELRMRGKIKVSLQRGGLRQRKQKRSEKALTAAHTPGPTSMSDTTTEKIAVKYGRSYYTKYVNHSQFVNPMLIHSSSDP